MEPAATHKRGDGSVMNGFWGKVHGIHAKYLGLVEEWIEALPRSLQDTIVEFHRIDEEVHKQTLLELDALVTDEHDWTPESYFSDQDLTALFALTTRAQREQKLIPELKAQIEKHTLLWQCTVIAKLFARHQPIDELIIRTLVPRSAVNHTMPAHRTVLYNDQHMAYPESAVNGNGTVSAPLAQTAPEPVAHTVGASQAKAAAGDLPPTTTMYVVHPHDTESTRPQEDAVAPQTPNRVTPQDTPWRINFSRRNWLAVVLIFLVLNITHIGLGLIAYHTLSPEMVLDWHLKFTVLLFLVLSALDYFFCVFALLTSETMQLPKEEAHSSSMMTKVMSAVQIIIVIASCIANWPTEGPIRKAVADCMAHLALGVGLIVYFYYVHHMVFNFLGRFLRMGHKTKEDADTVH